MYGQAHARPENLVTLYQTLNRRWRSKPLFLHRTLSYNLGQKPPPPPNAPPLQTAHQQPSNPPSAPPNGGAGGSTNDYGTVPNAAGPSVQCNGQQALSQQGESQTWELEVNTCVWNRDESPPRQARVGGKLSAGGGIMRLPIFIAFSSPGPYNEGDSCKVFPVNSMYPALVPVAFSGNGAKVLLELPGRADQPPQGKLLCIIWDDPDDVRVLAQTSARGHKPVSALDGVPFGGTAVWCHASIPVKDAAPLTTVPVLRRSRMKCTTGQDCSGAQFVHVQMTASDMIPATLCIKLCLRRRAAPTDSPSLNGHQYETSNPTAPQRLLSRTGGHMMFFLSGSELGHQEVLEVRSDWRCPLCRRRLRNYQALQMHLLGTHDRFHFFFKQTRGRHAIHARAGQADSDSMESPYGSSPAAGTKYVYWRRDWVSPAAAFHALLRRRPQAQREPWVKSTPAVRSREMWDELERKAKRQRTTPPESEPPRAQDEVEGTTAAAGAFPKFDDEGRVPGGRPADGAAAERLKQDGAGDQAKGREGDSRQQLADHTDTAGSPHHAPIEPDPGESQLRGEDESVAALDGENERTGTGTPHFRRHLWGTLEPHRAGSEQPPSGRCASVGPASSAGESGPAAAVPWTMRNTEGGEGSSGRGETKVVAPKKKGGSKAKRKPMDEDRNLETLEKRTFYHSRTGMAMDLEDVLNSIDSEDEVDEEELQQDDKRMLDDFSDVSVEEKWMMYEWNCFARQQRIAADAHMPWASRAFAHVHKHTIGGDPGLRRVFMLMLVKFWNCALLSADDVDDCLKTVDLASEG